MIDPLLALQPAKDIAACVRPRKRNAHEPFPLRDPAVPPTMHARKSQVDLADARTQHQGRALQTRLTLKHPRAPRAVHGTLPPPSLGAIHVLLEQLTLVTLVVLGDPHGRLLPKVEGLGEQQQREAVCACSQPLPH